MCCRGNSLAHCSVATGNRCSPSRWRDVVALMRGALVIRDSGTTVRRSGGGGGALIFKNA